MRIFLGSLLILFSLTGSSQQSIYSFKVTSVKGSEIDFNNFQGKNILIVNIATGSDRHGQMQHLSQLCRAYADSGLVIVAFPTNDFFHEPKTNGELAVQYASLPTNFFVAEKSIVKGVNMTPIYQWITHRSQNAVMECEIKGDFQKFIINRAGKIKAVYSGIVPPDAPLMSAMLSGQ